MHVLDNLADAVLVYRSRELSLGTAVATVLLEANADCDNAICAFSAKLGFTVLKS